MKRRSLLIVTALLAVLAIGASADWVTKTVAVGKTPYALAVNPVTNKIYVANKDSNSVTVIDGATNSTTTVAVDSLPYAVAVNPVTNKIYVANRGSDTVTVIDGATNSTTSVAVGHWPWAVAVNPVTNKIYVVNRNGNTVTVIDGATNGTTTVTVGTQPQAVAVNPVTNKIYVTNYVSNTVTVIDGATNGTTTVAVGTTPYAVAVNPVTNKIYVANSASNTVTVIDGATNGTTTVAGGAYAYAVAVNPVTNKIYVPDYDNDTLTVIDGATNATTFVAVGDGPLVVAVNPVTNKIYVGNQTSNNATVITEVPTSDTQVWAVIDTLPGNTTGGSRPALAGKGVNRWTPKPTTRIEGVLFGLNSAQRPWRWTPITSGSGTDSVRWTSNWGTDSLIKGENFVLGVALESDAAITGNLGIGTPMAGNLMVYPLYRMNSISGIEDRAVAFSAIRLAVRPVPNPFVSYATVPGRESERFNLYDVSGRKVGSYRGDNIGSDLSTGVYFLKLTSGDSRPVRIVKVR
jgi:YVTN family beta-propeller protein